MSAVLMSEQPRLTRRDLAAMPDEGRRYELLDGELLVTPAPGYPHQRAAFLLARLLDDACPPDVRVLMAPFAVVLADDTELQPDVLVARRADLTDADLPAAPLLAVEVLSPSTRLTDLTRKRERFERAGTASYWVFDPAERRLRAWDLRDGAYVEVADVTGDAPYTAEKPFSVTVIPGTLVD